MAFTVFDPELSAGDVSPSLDYLSEVSVQNLTRPFQTLPDPLSYPSESGPVLITGIPLQ